MGNITPQMYRNISSQMRNMSDNDLENIKNKVLFGQNSIILMNSSKLSIKIYNIIK